MRAFAESSRVGARRSGGWTDLMTSPGWSRPSETREARPSCN